MDFVVLLCSQAEMLFHHLIMKMKWGFVLCFLNQYYFGVQDLNANGCIVLHAWMSLLSLESKINPMEGWETVWCAILLHGWFSVAACRFSESPLAPIKVSPVRQNNHLLLRGSKNTAYATKNKQCKTDINLHQSQLASRVVKTLNEKDSTHNGIFKTRTRLIWYTSLKWTLQIMLVLHLNLKM